MKSYKFIISGGGTGGHIYPAIAIADEIKSRMPDAEILFVGANDKMEMQRVPKAGYPIKGLWIAGLQRRLTLSNLLFPVKLLVSMMKSLHIIQSFKPDVVIGTGGFASGPLLKVASLCNIPTVLQEQNSYPGITNKWLAANASKIYVAYENLERFFPKDKIVLSGNPVRQDLVGVEQKREEALIHLKLDPHKKTLLVIGGSLGARRINQLIAAELDNLLDKELQIIWQCGKLYEEEYKKYNEVKGVQVLSFIERMDLVYAAADVIVSRAGASSVSELCIVGKPVIFIPSPNVAEDHQSKNAQAMVDKNAALMVKEPELEDKFMFTINQLLMDVKQIGELSENAIKNAKVDATKVIVDGILELVK